MREPAPPAAAIPPRKEVMGRRVSLPQQNPLKATFGLAGRLFRRARETVGAKEQRESETSPVHGASHAGTRLASGPIRASDA